MIPLALAAQDEKISVAIFPEIFGKILLAIVIFGAFLVGAFLLRAWVQRIIHKKQGDEHEEVTILYGRIVFSVTLVIGIFLALTLAGAPLAWFSGGVGLGLAFALKPILSNFFAGIILLTNEKFNIGDVVKLESGEIGKIIDIQSRATTIRSLDHTEVTIPNEMMLSTKVRCYTKNPVRRHDIEIGVGYGTNLKKAELIILQTLQSYAEIETDPAPLVLVQEIASSAVTFSVRFWLISRGLKWWIIRSEVRRLIFENLRAAGVDIPYPVQTLRVDQTSSDLLAQKLNFVN